MRLWRLLQGSCPYSRPVTIRGAILVFSPKTLFSTRMASGFASGDTIEVIDGSQLEGGGQILRNAAALCCLLGKPMRVEKIRAGRSTPGLRPQHLTGLQLICDICRGRLEGGSVGSTQVTFYPGRVTGGDFLGDTHTAGSITLLLQAALPCFLMGNSPGTMTLRGGTNADMAPQIDYMLMIFKPIAQKFGVHFDCDIARRGYYPKGGGEVFVTAYPQQQLNPVIMMDPGRVTKIYGRAFVAGVLPIRIAHEMAASCKRKIMEDFQDVDIRIETVKEQSALGNGTGMIVYAETDTGCIFAGTALGKKGMPAEAVGKTAGEMLLNQLVHGGCVDDFLQDQLIILMALSNGKSSIRCGPITLHTDTAISIAEQLTHAKFKVTNISAGQSVIECEGIGLTNSQLQSR